MEQRNEVALKKLCQANLRKIGIEDVARFDCRDMEWRELHEVKKGLVKEARSLLDKVGDETPEERALEIEAANDALMEMVDAVDVELDVRNGNSKRPMPTRDGDYAPEETSTALTRDQKMVDHVRARGVDTDYQRLGLGQYLRSMVLGASSDLERRALAGGSDSTGGYTVPDVLSAQLVDLMRANNRAMEAGAMTVPLDSDVNHVAKLASDPTPSWRTENSEVQESEPTFSRVTFEPKTLAVIVRASRELLEDSLNINEALPRMLAAALGQEMDRVVFSGSGTDPEPMGLDGISGVLEHAHNAELSSYTPLVRARRMVLDENATPGPWVMAPKVEEAFGDLVDSTGQPLRHPPILDRPNPLSMLTTSKLPTNLGSGDNEAVIYGGQWDQVAIGIRTSARIEVLRERYATNYQFGFLATLRMDVQAIRPNALVRITGVQV